MFLFVHCLPCLAAVIFYFFAVIVRWVLLCFMGPCKFYVWWSAGSALVVRQRYACALFACICRPQVRIPSGLVFFFFFVGSFGVPYIYDAALVFFSLFCRECFMLLALACRE